MAFKDYSTNPTSNLQIGDGIFIGPNMARDDVREALQQLAADGRGLYDFVDALREAAMYYETIAEGVANTSEGQIFTSPESGTLSFYLRTSSAPFYEAQGVVAAASAAAEDAAVRAETARALTAVYQAAVEADRETTANSAAQAVTARDEAEAITQDVSLALAAGTVSGLIGTRIYGSKAALDADLVPADGEYALVLGDATATNNDLYRKSGATTTGNWQGPLGFLAAASAEAQEALANAKIATQLTDALSRAVYDPDQSTITASRGSNGYNAASAALTGWQVAWTQAGAGYINAILHSFTLPATVEYVDVQLWQSDSGTHIAPYQPADTKLDQRTIYRDGLDPSTQATEHFFRLSRRFALVDGETYYYTVIAYDAEGARVQLDRYAAPATGSDFDKGHYLGAGGGWVATGAPTAFKAIDAVFQPEDVASLFEQASLVERSFPTVYKQSGGRSPTSGFAPGSFTGWAVGFVPAEGEFLEGLALFPEGLNVIDELQVTAYTRALAVGDGASNDGPGAVNDQLFYSKRLTRADLPDVDWTLATRQRVQFDLPFGEGDGTKIVLVTIRAFTGEAAAMLGMGFTSGVAAEPDYRKGWFEVNSNGAWQVIGGDAGTNGVSFLTYRKELSAGVSAATTEKAAPIGIRAEAGGDVVAEQATLTVAVPEVTVSSPAGDLVIAPGSLVLAAPTTTAIVGEAVTVNYDSDGLNAPGQVRLAYQFASNIVVTRTSDSAVLVRGVDYDVQAGTGYLYGKVNTGPFASTVNYTGHRSRYDLIYADASTGALGVAAGTNRIVDPEFEGWQAVLPAGKIALFKAFVYYDMATGAHAAELIPVYDVADLWKRDQVESLAERRRRNQAALRRVKMLLRSGARVDIAYVGDSRTHHYGGTFPFPTEAEQLVAGGRTRDNYQYFTRQTVTFADAGLPTYTEADPDFAALLSKDGLTTVRPALPNGSAGYTKESWTYHFRDALAAYGGSEVNVLNFGIGGTTSADGFTAGTRYNGSHPDLINAVKAVNADLVCISYGMNEPGSAATYGQVRAIAEAHIANGSEVIVWACGQVNSFGKRMDQATWTKLNADLERAANDAGAAFIPLHAVMGAGFEGAAGFSRKSMCGAELYVHQGVQEDRVIGGFGASVVV